MKKTRFFWWQFCLFVVCVAFSGESLCFAAPIYTITDLGTLGGAESYATSINNIGQIVGKAQTSNGAWHLFLWHEGMMQDLGSIDYPARINDSGSIVGWSGWTGLSVSAFIWQNGQYTKLGSLGGPVTGANAVNNFDQVVGGSRISQGGPYHAFLWENGIMRDLGTLGWNPNTAYSEAHDINDWDTWWEKQTVKTAGAPLYGKMA